MSFLDRIGAWMTRHIVADDPAPQSSRLDVSDGVGQQVADAMMAQVDSAAHAGRAFCDERHDSPDPGVFYSCTLAPGHGGDHECRIAGPSPRLLATWATAAGAITETPIYDEVARIQGARRLATGAMDARARTDAAEMEAEMLAVLDIGRTANALRDADTIAVDYALAGLIDDNPDLAALLHEGGEDR